MALRLPAERAPARVISTNVHAAEASFVRAGSAPSAWSLFLGSCGPHAQGERRGREAGGVGSAALWCPHRLRPLLSQRNSSLPDENNVARLQEELKALKVREGEAVASARELKLQLHELSDAWQVRVRGVPRLGAPRRPRLTRPLGRPQAHLARGGRWKESPRKLVLGELQDELMSVRLREAQALAEGRELRQRVVELETQVSRAARRPGEPLGVGGRPRARP